MGLLTGGLGLKGMSPRTLPRIPCLMAMILATLLLNKLNKLKLTGLNPKTDGLEGGVTTRGSYDGLVGDIGVLGLEGAPYDEEGGL